MLLSAIGESVPPSLVEPLTGVGLGARRALDFANFFRPRDRHLAELKMHQAKTFGQAQVNAVDRKWKDLTTNLAELTLLEEEFRQSLFR
jgi:hypothetical protein